MDLLDVTKNHGQGQNEAGQLDRIQTAFADAQHQLAETTQMLADRNREAAEVEGRLQAARADLATVQDQLAKMRQGLADGARPAQAPAMPGSGATGTPTVDPVPADGGATQPPVRQGP